MIDAPFTLFLKGSEFTVSCWYIIEKLTDAALNSFPRFIFDHKAQAKKMPKANQLKKWSDLLEPALGRDSWTTG